MLLKLLTGFVSIFSEIAAYFSRKQLIDAGKDAKEKEILQENAEALKEKRRIHSDIEHKPAVRERVRDFFRR